MFSVQCPKCLNRSFVVGSPRCFYCDNGGSGMPSTNDDVHIQEPNQEDAINFNVSSGFQNHLFLNKKPDENCIQENNKNNNVPSDSRILGHKNAQKRSIPETSGKDSEGISSNCRQSGVSHECAMTNYAKMSKIKFDNCRLADNSHNQDTQVLGNFDKKGHSTVEQIIPSNIRISQSDQKEKAQTEIFESMASEEAGVRCKDDILSIPGPSSYNENNQDSNLAKQKFHYKSEFEQQSGVLTDKEKFICLICEKKIDEHGFIRGRKTFYDCCVCIFRSDKKSILVGHINSQGRDHYYCEICEYAFKKKGFHDTEKTCFKCNPPKAFQCKTLLVEHYFVLHDSCPLCLSAIYLHLSAVKKHQIYECCAYECYYENTDRAEIKYHLYSHIEEKPLKCDLCLKRFSRLGNIKRHKCTKRII